MCITKSQMSFQPNIRAQCDEAKVTVSTFCGEQIWLMLLRQPELDHFTVSLQWATIPCPTLERPWGPGDQVHSRSLSSKHSQAGRDGQTITTILVEASTGNNGRKRSPGSWSQAFPRRKKWYWNLEGCVGVKPRLKAEQNVSHLLSATQSFTGALP